MATADKLLAHFAETIDGHDWDGLAQLLHPDFVCRLVHTGESFGRDDWVRFNANYPGFQSMQLLDAVVSGDRAVGRGHVVGETDGVPQHFEVASFLTVRDGLIVELTEVWADSDSAPPEGTRLQ